MHSAFARRRVAMCAIAQRLNPRGSPASFDRLGFRPDGISSPHPSTTWAPRGRCSTLLEFGCDRVGIRSEFDCVLAGIQRLQCRVARDRRQRQHYACSGAITVHSYLLCIQRERTVDRASRAGGTDGRSRVAQHIYM